MSKGEREKLPDFISWTTKEIKKEIDSAVEKQALQMTGGAAGKAALGRAKKIARSIIMDEIRQAIAQQAKARKKALKEHNRMVEDYNAFCRQEMSEPGFKAVQQFAVHEYFEAQPLATQRAIKEAYMRVESNEATAADTELVKRYFTDAKRDYYKKMRRRDAIER